MSTFIHCCTRTDIVVEPDCDDTGYGHCVQVRCVNHPGDEGVLVLGGCLPVVEEVDRAIERHLLRARMDEFAKRRPSSQTICEHGYDQEFCSECADEAESMAIRGEHSFDE